MKTRNLFVAAAILTAFAAQSFASTYIIESRAGGLNVANFTQSGAATTTAKSSATGLTAGIGSYYAGDTSPAKWGQWTFTPTITGYYDVAGTWAVNAYAAGVTPPTWLVNNAGTAVSLQVAQTAGGNAWNSLATGLKFNASTAYATRLTTAATGISNKRTYFDSVRWVSSTPTAAANSGPANGATDIPLTGALNDLSWTAGSFNSFFDVWFGLSGNMSKVTTLAEGTTTWDPESWGTLSLGTTYEWRIDAINVDQTITGTTFNFITLVPEPSTALLGLLGGLGLMWIARRRMA